MRNQANSYRNIGKINANVDNGRINPRTTKLQTEQLRVAVYIRSCVSLACVYLPTVSFFLQFLLLLRLFIETYNVFDSASIHCSARFAEKGTEILVMKRVGKKNLSRAKFLPSLKFEVSQNLS